VARTAKNKRPVGRPKTTRELRQTTVYLSPSVHRAAKVRAAENDQRLSDVVELALVKLLKLRVETAG